MTKRKEHSPAVVVDSGSSYEEPIPFAGIVEIEPDFDYDDDPSDAADEELSVWSD